MVCVACDTHLPTSRGGEEKTTCKSEDARASVSISRNEERSVSFFSFAAELTGEFGLMR